MTESLHLFLAESDEILAHTMRETLVRAGHRVSCCRSGADAMIVLGHSSFDLALLGRQLSDRSGLDLLADLANEGLTVPVLILVAAGDEELAIRALRLGAVDYLRLTPGRDVLSDLPQRVADCVAKYRLEKINRLLIQALESTQDGVVITDLQGVILHINQALERISGYSRQELLGRSASVFKSGRQTLEFYGQMWRTILGRSSWQGELINRRKDGSLYDVSMTISPILDAQGRLTHFVGIQRDVTQHRQLQRQLLQAQKMQSVGTLAGGVAHEFNNLLAGISGYAWLGLLDSHAEADLREVLQNVVALTERAAILTRQLLTFARMPALARQPTSMLGLVRQTGELVRRSLHLEVRLDLPDPVPADEETAYVLEADVNQLQQALVNLALNSRDALRGRVDAPAVTFRVSEQKLTAPLQAFPQPVPPGEYVLLQVEDHGCGMAPEVLAQALDPFFTTKDVGEGTGLGLPVVFGIVQGHQGYLTLRSGLGQGASVGLFLPRRRSTPPPAPEPAGPGHDLEPDQGACYGILLIDDEEAVLEVMRRFLQLAGHRVTTATTAHQANSLLEGGLEVDLIVLDVALPLEKTLATIRRLRGRRPGVPLLLCSADESVPAELRHDGYGVLHKPFRMHELWYAVRQTLDGSKTDYHRGTEDTEENTEKTEEAI